jgi:hypothetical protein
MAVVIELDGVLKNSITPIVSGINLYKILNQKYKVFIICGDKKKAENFLLSNRLNKVDDLIDESFVPHEYGRALNKRQIDFIRSKGNIDFVVTANTMLAKQLLEDGLEVLLFLHPHYIRPEFRPDMAEGVRRWADIESEIDKQNAMIQNDKRVL